jgi:hypothetical protein
MKPFLIGLAIGTIILLILINFGSGFRSEQPITFNHKKHQAQGVECATCHSHFKEQSFSGMPKISICMECHKESITKHPDEEKIRQFQKKGEEIPWKRVYQQPDDVFFSHRRHVVLARMECKNCHGDLEQSEKPPSTPWVKMTMKWCMDCHTKTKANNDCLACHI